jgi:hypothetical protein
MRAVTRAFFCCAGAAFVTGLVVACGSSSESVFLDAGTPSTGFDTDAALGASDPNEPDADLYANDPPPPWCGPDGGGAEPPKPGGTEACPDDKNKPGCSCATPGQTAPCWTGLRKQRGLGICKDGKATCVRQNELNYVWGKCEGEVLPVVGATKGADACSCFSAGQWKIANLSPCFAKSSCTDADHCSVVNAVSTIPSGNSVACPPDNPPTSAPAEAWSTSTLKVDCAGHFKLCLRIRAGDFTHPDPANDCIVGEVCTEGDYTEANVEQKWEDLPGWLGKDPACAAKWAATSSDKSAGYAEMIVKGQSVRCDAIDDGSGNDLVFNRVQYCPSKCNDPAHQNDTECVSCGQAAQGSF